MANPTGVIPDGYESERDSKKANGKNKTQAVAALMRRPKGATREEVLALTQWPSMRLQAVAKAADVKLRVDNKERPYRYHAA